jgi:DNA invertase Pin-like site-specific DNA recombinase
VRWSLFDVTNRERTTSERRSQILILRAAGLTQRETARRVGCTVRTVKRVEQWSRVVRGARTLEASR